MFDLGDFLNQATWFDSSDCVSSRFTYVTGSSGLNLLGRRLSEMTIRISQTD